MSAFLRFALLLAALLPTVCAVRYASPPSCGLYAECQRTLHCLCVSPSERSLRSLCLAFSFCLKASSAVWFGTFYRRDSAHSLVRVSPLPPGASVVGRRGEPGPGSRTGLGS